MCDILMSERDYNCGWDRKDPSVGTGKKFLEKFGFSI